MKTPGRFSSLPRARRPAVLTRQRGITLIVALIMLTLLTLLALTSFNLGNSTLQVVNNMQVREAAVAAARQTIEEAMSSSDFYMTPDNALKLPCNQHKNTRCVDTNGDAVTDVTVRLDIPVCSKIKAIKNNDLVDTVDDPNASRCGANQDDYGIERSSGDSQCVNAVWELKATATDDVTATEVVVVQGITARNSVAQATTACP